MFRHAHTASSTETTWGRRLWSSILLSNVIPYCTDSFRKAYSSLYQSELASLYLGLIQQLERLPRLHTASDGVPICVVGKHTHKYCRADEISRDDRCEVVTHQLSRDDEITWCRFCCPSQNLLGFTKTYCALGDGDPREKTERDKKHIGDTLRERGTTC